MSPPLIVVGAACQFSGFGLALYQSLSTRRREVPEARSLFVDTGRLLAQAGHRGYEWSRRVLRRALRAIGFHRVIVYDSGTATVSGGGAISVESHVVRKSKPLDERVSDLEEEVQTTRDEIAGLRIHMETRIGEAVGEVEEARRAQLRRSLLLGEGGVWMFLVGLVLTTIGAL